METLSLSNEYVNEELLKSSDTVLN